MNDLRTQYPPLLTRQAAANMTGLSARYIDRLRKDGTLKTYVTKGGHHRFYRDELIYHVKLNEPTTL
jgi:excisionase family DNA binding protein